MPAILTYLAELNGLESWWPKEMQAQAKIQSYLHSHHSLTRLATLTLMAPHVLTVFDEPPFGPGSTKWDTHFLSKKIKGFTHNYLTQGIPEIEIIVR